MTSCMVMQVTIPFMEKQEIQPYMAETIMMFSMVELLIIGLKVIQAMIQSMEIPAMIR